METPEERQAKISRLRSLISKPQEDRDESEQKEFVETCCVLAPWLLGVSDALAKIVDAAGDAYVAAYPQVEGTFDIAAARAENTQEQRAGISEAWEAFSNLGDALNVFEEDDEEGDEGDEGDEAGGDAEGAD